MKVAVPWPKCPAKDGAAGRWWTPTGKFLWAITSNQNACFSCDVGVQACSVDPNPRPFRTAMFRLPTPRLEISIVWPSPNKTLVTSLGIASFGLRDYIKCMWPRIFFFTLLTASAFAQNPAASPTPSSQVNDDFLHQQFGSTCSVDSKFSPMTGDLNGDGIEDIVIVGRCKNALIDQDEKNYKVIDPMNSFYGYGNPKITSTMGQQDPRLKGISILIIHGSGPDAWRAASPGEKFVIINIDVKTAVIKKMKINKKKSTMAIYIEEATGDEMTAAIFWDGKKYKYEPLGSAME